MDRTAAMVLCDKGRRTLDPANVRRAMHSLLKKANFLCTSRRIVYPRNPQTGGSVQLPDIPWKNVEPATRIERATCGLRIVSSSTSDNLTPQETTSQDLPDMGREGASLSCPGSTTVAEHERPDRQAL